MKKLKFAAFVLFFSLLLAAPVSAQYDTNVILPEYRDGGEVYGVNVAASQRVSMFPEGCESIDKITIESQNPINGEIFVKPLGENPKPDVTELDKVFEYCHVELRNINQTDLRDVDVELKVRKNWLTDNDVSSDQMALFTFNETDRVWEPHDTSRKTESSIYFFYSSSAENFPNWAVARYAPGLLAGINPGLLLLCCIILLIVFILAALLLSSRRQRETTQSSSKA
jgi:PGF-pre-PGF domain-containing protein